MQKILEENKRRLGIINAPYNPVSGEGSDVIPRSMVFIEEIGVLFLPTDMIEENDFIKALIDKGSFHTFISQSLRLECNEQAISDTLSEFIKIRIRYDFEFWAASFVCITDKLTAQDVPFILTYPQRILLKSFERQRREGKPIRVILLKARQWGGSTLTQIYMAWIQLVHRSSWNSVICAHVKDASATIKGMYTKLLAKYPTYLTPDGEKAEFKPFERTQNISIIKSTGCKVTIGSAEVPDSVRSQNVYMAHLSEVAFYRDTDKKKASDLIRSIISSIPIVPYTMTVVESTANGEGDYFYKEYMLAKQGKSDKEAVFIPWFYISMYSAHIDDYEDLITSLSDYEKFLWEKGATLEAIAWYRNKRKEYQEHQQMKSEYPSDDVEAFASTGEGVFDKYLVEKLKANCKLPEMIGEVFSRSKEYKGKICLSSLFFSPEEKGKLAIWSPPDDESISNRYVVAVDVGGRSHSSDFSVIVVFDRYWQMYGGVPEVVAEWYGHIDHDLLVWKAAQIAMFYNKALLVIESNTPESEQYRYTDGEHTEFILDTLGDAYQNLYSRTDPTKIREGAPIKYGFHTNRSTKSMIIDNMIAILRDNPYIEHDENTIFEFNLYEKKQNGSFGAKDGYHDDKIMARMIGLYVCYKLPIPKEIESGSRKTTRNPVNESTIL